MDKQMLSMNELEQVNGGNFFTDALDYVVDTVKDVPRFTKQTLEWTQDKIDSVPLLPELIDVML